MAGLYKKYNEQGLHIIGLECQASAPDVIKTMAKSKSMEYQVTVNGDLRGTNVTGIPHGFLFSPDGKLAVDNPSIGELETKVKELLKDTQAIYVGPGPYTKMGLLLMQAKLGRDLGAVLKQLASKKASKDAVEAQEAAALYDALKTGGQKRLDSALEQKTGNPLGALKRFEQLALLFAGDEIGTKAKAEGDALRKDPNMQKEVQAEAMYKQLAAMEDALKPFQGSKDPKSDGFRRINAMAIQSIVAGCQVIQARHPGTEGARKSGEMMEQYR